MTGVGVQQPSVQPSVTHFVGATQVVATLHFWFDGHTEPVLVVLDVVSPVVDIVVAVEVLVVPVVVLEVLPPSPGIFVWSTAAMSSQPAPIEISANIPNNE